MSDFYAAQAMPGPGAVSTTTERNALLGPITWYLLKGVVVKSTASDAGNTPTTELRHGLLMAKLDADGLYEHYQPNATTGAAVVQGFLFTPARTIDTDGTSVNRPNQIVIAGYAQASQLLLLDQQARAQMFGRFIFDDDLPGNSSGWRQVVAKVADYTVLVADNNTIFTNAATAALVTFTLPVIAKGLRYRFYCEDNDGIKIVSATTDTLVVFNDIAADSVAFSTTGRCIGAAFEIFANADASKWLVFPFIWNAVDDGTTVSKATIVT
jgi:hypothetical protein